MGHFRLLFLFFLIFSFSIFGQNKCDCILKGTITSKETKQKIVDANVYLKGTKYGARSDSKGFYQLTNLCPGTYQLVCEINTFDKEEITITIKEENFHDFNLHEHEEHLQEVIISGKKLESSSQMTGKLSTEEREQRNGLNLGEMLKGISGIQSLMLAY